MLYVSLFLLGRNGVHLRYLQQSEIQSYISYLGNFESRILIIIVSPKIGFNKIENLI